MIYKNCVMKTFYGETPTEPQRCIVRIDEMNIVIEYGYQYSGVSTSPNHYSLTSVGFEGGKAELELTDDGCFLQGTWIEGQSSGRWEIDLHE